MTGTGLSLGNHTSFFFDRNLKIKEFGAEATVEGQNLQIFGSVTF